jgi:hypothetical protein
LVNKLNNKIFFIFKNFIFEKSYDYLRFAIFSKLQTGLNLSYNIYPAGFKYANIIPFILLFF